MMKNVLKNPRVEVEADGPVDLRVVVVGVELPLAGELLEGAEAGWAGAPGEARTRGRGAVSQGAPGPSAAGREGKAAQCT